MTNPPGKNSGAPGGKPLAGVRVLVLFGATELFGAERSNLEVFRSLRELGLEAHFLTHRKYGAAQIEPELARLGFARTPAWFGSQWGRYLLGREWYYWFVNLWCVMAVNWRVWRAARTFRATHVYAMNQTQYSYGAFALRWLGLPFVYRAGDEFSKHNVIYRAVMRALVARVDAVVAISEFIRRSVVADGVAAARVRVVYNQVPDRETGVPVATPPVPDGAQMICYVGQLAEHKGILVLLEAAEQMLRSGRNVVFWLVGAPGWDEGQFAQLRARAAAGGFGDRIYFAGYQRDVFPFLARADVHVCPSLFAEPLGNVVVEAKLQGKPSVVFPSGGLPELIHHGVDGWVCRDRSAAALVEGLEEFLADPARTRAAGAAARRSLEERFSREKYLQTWTEVFLATSGGKMRDSR